MDDLKSKLFSTAVRYLNYRDRSEHELRLRLEKESIKLVDVVDQDVIDQVLSFLNDHKFVNDYNFAEQLAISQLRKGNGPVKIAQVMYQKGVAKDISSQIIANLEPQQIEEAILKRIEKRRRVLERKHEGRQLQMAIQHDLQSRGFRYQDYKELEY